MTEYLNIFDLCEGTKALGPGLRYVIWVQGCPFNCKGCTSPEGRPIKENILVDVEKIAQSVIRNNLIEGLTISGGEPFLQASKLSDLLKTVKKARRELTVIVYTGFEINELDWKEAKELLSFTDVLIDGVYVDALNDNKGLRGSSNQIIHFLTDKLKQYEDEFENSRRNIEIIVSNTYNKIIGVPNIFINHLI
jgi:anaerobic ribonucleoside-triphosphate reductase activating protein